MEQRHEPNAGQFKGASRRIASNGDDGGAHAAQGPDEQVAPVHVAAVGRIIHEGVPDAPVARIHQVAGVGQPGVAIGFEKEAGLGHAFDRVGRDGGTIERLRGVIGVPREETDMSRQ